MMGRSAEFRGAAAYGNFEPAKVDIDLADPKITDHPHYSQSPGAAFHDPNQPSSDTCQQCGKPRSQHSRVSLPPTREGYEAAVRMAEGHRESVREAKARGARESDQDDKAKASPYGLGGNKALRKHLAEKHELEPEDAADMDRPHHYHRQWHTLGQYNPDGHTH